MCGVSISFHTSDCDTNLFGNIFVVFSFGEDLKIRVDSTLDTLLTYKQNYYFNGYVMDLPVVEEVLRVTPSASIFICSSLNNDCNTDSTRADILEPEFIWSKFLYISCTYLSWY